MKPATKLLFVLMQMVLITKITPKKSHQKHSSWIHTGHIMHPAAHQKSEGQIDIQIFEKRNDISGGLKNLS